MRLLHTFMVAALCMGAGLGIFVYKWKVLEFPLLPNQTAESWHIEAKVEYQAKGEPVKLRLYLPRSTDSLSIVDENFISDSYGFSIRREKQTGNRVGRWTKREARGREVIFYRAILYEVNRTAEEQKSEPPETDLPLYGSNEFKLLAEDDPVYLALSDLIGDLRQRSADDESFVSELFKVMRKGKDERISRLRDDLDLGSPAALAVRILSHASIPAKVVNGLILDENNRDAELRAWVSVYQDGAWLPVDMQTGKLNTGQPLLPWWEGDKRAFTVAGGNRASLTFSVKRHVESALTEALWKGDEWTQTIYDLSVFSLPVNLQLVFSVLLLVPVGALVAAFLRQIIGVATFGTFMPVLIALAFRETQLLWGIILFSVIVGLGLLIRSYFDRLQLLLVPRLTAVLTVVVLIIFGITLVTFRMGMNAGLSVSLFPMVILTMVIERMSLTWEEFGARQALRQGAGSLLVAAIAYMVMSHDLVEHLIVTFPELLLVILALALLLGRYNGYKLTEYYRFRSLNGAL